LYKQSPEKWRNLSRGLKETEAKYGKEQLGVCRQLLQGCAEKQRDTSDCGSAEF